MKVSGTKTSAPIIIKGADTEVKKEPPAMQDRSETPSRPESKYKSKQELVRELQIEIYRKEFRGKRIEFLLTDGKTIELTVEDVRGDLHTVPSGDEGFIYGEGNKSVFIKKITGYREVDHADLARIDPNDPLGGIKLDSNMIDWKVKKDAASLSDFQFSPSTESLRNAEGFVPVIIQIKQLPNFPLDFKI